MRNVLVMGGRENWCGARMDRWTGGFECGNVARSVGRG